MFRHRKGECKGVMLEQLKRRVFEQNMALKLGIYAYAGSMEDDISPYDEIEEILEYLF